MAIMYFAKISINSNIYKLYKDRNVFFKIIDKMYYGINESIGYTNKADEEFRFNSLMYNESSRIVAGRLSKIYNGSVERYDRKSNKPEAIPTEDLSSSANFCFDVKNEIIAYVVPRNFGYIEFCSVLKNMLEIVLDNIELNIQIIPNIGDVKAEINNIYRISELSLTLIPPNPPNLDEFNSLFEGKAEYIIESEATRYTEKLECSNKKEEGIKKGKFINNAYTAIKKGYGKLVAKGKNSAGDNVTVNSEKSTPYKQSVHDKYKDDIGYINKVGTKGIEKILLAMNKGDE